MSQVDRLGRANRRIGIALLSFLIVWSVAGTATSETRMYRGTLAIAFGGFPASGFSNRAIPSCRANPFLMSTVATLPVTGFLEQGEGAAPRSLMFGEYAPIDANAQTGGGQEPVSQSTCYHESPNFASFPWQIRSNIRATSQVWPGKVMNAARDGFSENLPGGGTLVAGAGLVTPVSFEPFGDILTAIGQEQSVAITPGPNRFGGAAPINRVGGRQLGSNVVPTAGPLSQYPFMPGIQPYFENRLANGPAVQGTSATDPNLPAGAIMQQPGTWAVRTPGPSGFASTLPRTEFFGLSHGAIDVLEFPELGSPLLTVMSDAHFFGAGWTTGKVRFFDGGAPNGYQRTATGHDWSGIELAANGVTSLPYGTTRQIQLVTPHASSHKLRGTEPWAINFVQLDGWHDGGLAVLTLNIAPVPEPGLPQAVLWGSMSAFAWGAQRARRSEASRSGILSEGA